MPVTVPVSPPAVSSGRSLKRKADQLEPGSPPGSGSEATSPQTYTIPDLLEKFPPGLSTDIPAYEAETDVVSGPVANEGLVFSPLANSDLLISTT